MPAVAPAPPTAAPPKFATVRDVEIFQAGVHKGEAYSEADLQDIVDNAAKLIGVVDPSLAIGHEEEQDLLDNTGLPAVGWATNVRKHGDKLVCDFSEVPPLIAKLINRRAYKKVSAEIYDQPPEGTESTGAKGKVLRRVALLGGELPHIKTLADLPLAEYSESNPRRHKTPVVVLKFSETTSRPDARTHTTFFEVVMDRQAALDWLAANGVDIATVTPETPDAFLASLVQSLQAKMGGSGDPSETPVPAEGQMADGTQTPTATTPIPTPAPAAAPAPAAQPASPMPNGQPSKVILQYSEEHKAKMAEVEADLTRLKKFAEDQKSAAKKSLIKTKLDTLVAAGKVLPAEREGGLDDVLYAADDTHVLKFSEGGKTVERTPFDKLMATLEARPVLVSFAERMKQPAAGAKSADDDVAKVRRFSEEPGMAKALQAAGKDSATYVAEFEAARKTNPKLTAVLYGVPANYAN